MYYQTSISFPGSPLPTPQPTSLGTYSPRPDHRSSSPTPCTFFHTNPFRVCRSLQSSWSLPSTASQPLFWGHSWCPSVSSSSRCIHSSVKGISLGIRWPSFGSRSSAPSPSPSSLAGLIWRLAHCHGGSALSPLSLAATCTDESGWIYSVRYLGSAGTCWMQLKTILRFHLPCLLEVSATFCCLLLALLFYFKGNLPRALL